MAFELPGRIGGLTDDERLRFLAEPWNGRLATVTADGWPYIAPVWYEFDPGPRHFLVVRRERAEWVGHVQRNPRLPEQQRIEQLACRLPAAATALRYSLEAEVSLADDLHLRRRGAHAVTTPAHDCRLSMLRSTFALPASKLP